MGLANTIITSTVILDGVNELSVRRHFLLDCAYETLRILRTRKRKP
jgi:hypothetical protein